MTLRNIIRALSLALALSTLATPAPAGGLSQRAAEMLRDSCKVCCSPPCLPYCDILERYIVQTGAYNPETCLAYVTARLAENETLRCAKTMCDNLFKK